MKTILDLGYIDYGELMKCHEKVDLGMTEAEVRSLYGKPDLEAVEKRWLFFRKIEQRKSTEWKEMSNPKYARRILYTFENGYLITSGYGVLPSEKFAEPIEPITKADIWKWRFGCIRTWLKTIWCIVRGGKQEV